MHSATSRYIVQYMYIVGKYKIYLYKFQKHVENRWAFLFCVAESSNKFYSYQQHMYFAFILQCQKVQNNLNWTRKRRNECRCNNFRKCLLLRLCLYCYHFLLCSTRIRYQKTFLGPWLNNHEVYFTPSLVHAFTIVG